ncbi:hypothetical protein [Sphingobacteruim zhuxiongii]|nr:MULTISPECIES: hypothetical protein [unclassified Sphingobacterium]
MRITLITLLILTFMSCAPEKTANADALVLLNKLGMIEQFDAAIEKFTPENLASQLLPSQTTAFEAYKEKYFASSTEDFLVSELMKVWSPEEIQQAASLKAEDLDDKFEDKIRETDKYIEKRYDDIYLAGHALLSGIEVIASPNQSTPFSYLKVNRPNGFYPVEAYDFHMLQRMHIAEDPIIDGSELKNTTIYDYNTGDYGLSIPETDKLDNLFQLHFADSPKTPIILILANRIMTVWDRIPTPNQGQIILYTT